MKITGQFRDINQRLYRVDVQDNSPLVDIKTCGEDGIYLDSDSVEITREISDLFQPIIVHSCKVTFHTENYEGGSLFTVDSRGIELIITDEDDDKVVYRGWVEPQIFNQGFSLPLDQFTINSTDDLGTLQYVKYKDAKPENYAELYMSASTVTVKSILDDVAVRFLGGKDKVVYDKSVGLTSASTATVFAETAVSEINFYGDNADNVDTYTQVLENILRYFNLHIMQVGDITYIFNWKSIKSKRNEWIDLNGDTVTLTAPTVHTMKKAMHADSDTNISIEDAYNQVKVKAITQKKDDIIENPMDTNDLKYFFTGRQHFLKEYWSVYKVKAALYPDRSVDYMTNPSYTSKNFNGWVDMVQRVYDGDKDKFKECKYRDWYMQHCYNKNWKFYTYDKTTNERSDVNDLLEQDRYGNYINQYELTQKIFDNPCSAIMLKFGSEEKNMYVTDNSIQNTMTMTPYLCISINGNQDDTIEGHEPKNDKLSGATPLCEYTSPQAGGNYSPQDDSTVNYIVFSGDMLLQAPLRETSPYYDVLLSGHTSAFTNEYITAGVEAEDGEKRYYTRCWITSTYPNGMPHEFTTSARTIMPPLDNPPMQDKDKMAYDYSAIGDGTDKFSKLPILECELIIGNKRLIEVNMDMYGNSEFQWVTIGEEPTEYYWDYETQSIKSYTATTFSLGVDPRPSDWTGRESDTVVNQNYEMQNTVHWSMNINAKGTAIPIKASDNLSGDITFRILGPINTVWEQITRRHPSFWRHTKWRSDAKFVLAHTETIFIKNFSAKLYSSVGDYDKEPNDLIYLSDEDDYVNLKKATDFKLITQPTYQQCVDLGIDYITCVNAFTDVSTGAPLQTLYNAADGEEGIPEELYVNNLYQEFHIPKILMQGTLKMRELEDWREIYKSGPLGNKEFFVQKMVQDLRYANSQVTLKEC